MSETGAVAPAARLDELESLRGLLALWVVLGHLLSAAGLHVEAWPGPLKLLAQGTLAVDVFIVLSGFVIFFLLDTSAQRYPRFILQRAFRLFPAYLVCLVASALLVEPALTALRSLPWLHPHNETRVQIFLDTLQYFPAHLLAHALLLHGLVPGALLPSTDYAVMGQAWSLSLEWQFYLVAPWVFSLCRARYALALTAGTLAAHLLLAGSPAFLPTKAPLFALGILSYRAYRAVMASRATLGPYHALLLPIGVVVSVAAFKSPGLVLWAVVFCALLSTRVGPGDWLSRALCGVLRVPVLEALGRRSYSIYCSHMVVLYLLLPLLVPLFPSDRQLPFFASLLTCVLAGTLLLSHLLWRYVEVPMNALGKRVVGARSKVPAAA